jgi:hypothetical protein
MTTGLRAVLKPLVVALLIGLTLLAAAGATAAKTPICAVCGKAITHDHVEVDGQLLHPQCFVCAVCGKQIQGPYKKHEGRYVHATCWEERYAPRCAACRKPIAGKHIDADGRSFHPECFVCSVCGKRIDGPFKTQDGTYVHPGCWEERYAPRCGICGKPITGEFRKFEGASYHEACYAEHKAPVCLICGKRILGEILVNDWGETVHSEHEGAGRACSSCGRYALPGKSMLLPDGRLQCAACRRDAVRDIDHARSLTQKVADILAANGIVLRTPVKNINIKLVDQDQLGRLAPKARDTEGLYRVQTGTSGTVESQSIFVLSDLPADLFEGVAAHELFHLWQHEHRADHGPPSWMEGSAQVAADLVYRQLDSELAKHLQRNMLKTDDPIYGAGYREAKAYLERQGIGPLLDEIVRRGSNQPR